jgi:hypothetical protein
MRSSVALVVTAILFMPLLAGAQSQWSSVGAAGTVITADFAAWGYPTGGIYTTPLAGANGAGVSYLFGDAGFPENDPFSVAYNVTSSELQPAWTTFTITYSGVTSSGSTISATLYQVSPTTGARTAICSVSSITTATTRSCTFSSTTFDFNSNGYYVEATIDRSSDSQRPTLNFLSIK